MVTDSYSCKIIFRKSVWSWSQFFTLEGPMKGCLNERAWFSVFLLFSSLYTLECDRCSISKCDACGTPPPTIKENGQLGSLIYHGPRPSRRGLIEEMENEIGKNQKWRSSSIGRRVLWLATGRRRRTHHSHNPLTNHRTSSSFIFRQFHFLFPRYDTVSGFPLRCSDCRCMCTELSKATVCTCILVRQCQVPLSQLTHVCAPRCRKHPPG